MATSTITVPVFETLGGGPYFDQFKRVATELQAAKTDIEGLSAASLASTTPAGPGTGAAGSASTGSKSDHVHPPSTACIPIAAESDPSDAIAETLVWRVKNATTISAVKVAPTGAVTGDDTDYATLTVKVRDGAGGSAATVASKTTKTTGGTGSWSAFTTKDLGSITNGTLAAGSVLTFTVAKSGAGQQLPAFVLCVDF